MRKKETQIVESADRKEEIQEDPPKRTKRPPWDKRSPWDTQTSDIDACLAGMSKKETQTVESTDRKQKEQEDLPKRTKRQPWHKEKPHWNRETSGFVDGIAF